MQNDPYWVLGGGEINILLKTVCYYGRYGIRHHKSSLKLSVMPDGVVSRDTMMFLGLYYLASPIHSWTSGQMLFVNDGGEQTPD